MVTTPDPNSSTSHAPVSQNPRTRAPLVRAWISIAVVPAFFVLSFLVQTVIYALTGYDPSTGTVPLWANLAAGVPGLAILLAPCITGIIYGRRAARSGDRAGLVPAAFAAVLGLGAVALTVASL